MRILVTIFLIGFSNVAFGQYFDKIYGFSLDVTTPLSNTEYVDNISARGFRFMYREMISEKFFGGLDLTNSTLTEYKPRQTYTNGSGAITTDLYNYTYNYGATLTFDYFLNTEKKLMPYAGLGVGASFLRFHQYYNVYTSQADSWGVLIRPQVGIFYRLRENSSWAFQAALHYDYSSAKSEELDLGALSVIGMQVGFVILDW
ncbi:MAG: hypothetical protein R2820_11000 [Cyclobacteriaceae bacterium]